MNLELKPQAFTTKFSYILLGLIGGGIVSFILSSFTAAGTIIIIKDILVVLILLGIIAALAYLLVLVEFINYFGLDSKKVTGVLLGLLVSIVFILADTFIPKLLKPLEEFSMVVRFRFSKMQLLSKDVSSGVIMRNLNDEAHPAIQIIGLDQYTINKYQEGFPISWRHYANFLAAMEGSKVNTVMFDIFFMDRLKNNYGLLSLIEDIRKDILVGVKSNSVKGVSVSSSEISRASANLSDAIRRNGKVTMDYSFELSRLPTDMDNKEYHRQLELLDRYRIVNVIPSEYDNRREWVNHPEPPLPEIIEGSKGIGFANIRKEQTGINRKLPLVIKWQGKIYPSIDLILAARYYGVDLQKDIEVKLGDYIRINNIPRVSKQVGIGKNNFYEDVMVKPNEERMIEIPIDEEGFMLINFIGGPWSYPDMPFAMVADAEKGEYGRQDPFENKILLVAIYYATGVAKDIHNSPFGEMAGIEHHANALNTILQQDFMHDAPPWVNYIIYLMVGLMIGLYAPRYNIKIVLFGSVIFLFLYTFEVFALFNFLNFIHVYFPVYIEMVISLILIIGYKVLTEEENVKYIRSTFSKFVSKDVVNVLLANPEAVKLGGDKKELTVFFSDVRGFTTISESLTPEDLVRLLNDYLSVMTEIVLDYKGTVDKYMGDAIMAFWGAPLEIKEHAYYACICALAQLKKLKEKQTEWQSKGWPIIDIGIGLNTGGAVVGNMGSAHRMDYTVMGDTINLGSRLEGTNKVYGTKIIISEYTYEACKDKVIVRELDKIKVKGKNEPVTIYELLDIIDQNDFQRFIGLV